MKLVFISFKFKIFILLMSFVVNGISAGFPSPAIDFEDSRIDLKKELIKHHYLPIMVV